MSDPERSGKAFKLFGKHCDCGVLAVFNVSENEKTVFAEISSGDMLLPDGKYVCYDWFAGKIMPDAFSVKLENHDDFRLYIFVPVKNGKAVLECAGQKKELDADSIVIAVGFRPAPSMAQELAGCGAVVYEVGDGQQVSTILHAVWDGYEVGSDI